MAERDHLFISYAWEDGALAEWLTLKLTAEGYLVWCDRFKMLGGECWPEDIDAAIKTQTFRMIHLLSKHSLHKENPSKERQLALTLSKNRKEDFLLPLNVDGLAPADLPWQLSDLNYIPFQNWASGFAQLLKKLQQQNAPKPLEHSGKSIVAEAFLPREVVADVPEVLQTNCIPFTKIPDVIYRFQLSRCLLNVEEQELDLSWPSYKINDTTFLSFQSPPAHDIPRLRIKRAGGTSWKDVPIMDGVRTTYIVLSLLKKTLASYCVSKGLTYKPEIGIVFFPKGLLDKDRILYRGYKGRMTRIGVIGERRFGQSKSLYHLGFAFWIRRDPAGGYVAQIKIRLQLFDPAGREMEPRRALKARKKIAKSWWNHQWLSRQMAIRSFLAGGGESIVIGTRPKEQVVLSSAPLMAEVPKSVNEAYLRALKASIQTQQLLETEAIQAYIEEEEE